jgi:hypothetical protein
MEKMTEKLPQTDSIQELAQFWDTHDVTEFEGQLEEVREPVFCRGTVVKIELSSDEAKAVETIARIRGIDPAALIHEWVTEKSHTA